MVHHKPYILWLHKECIDTRKRYTLTVTLYLCGVKEKLSEMIDRVSEALPANNFSLLFEFDYTNVIKTSEVDVIRLEKNIIDLIALGHYKVYNNKLTRCMSDVLYIE